MIKNSIITLLVLCFMSCEDRYHKMETNISARGDDESHYTGDNCMNCHYTVGEGEGWFSLAGSTFGDKYKNGIVKVLTEKGNINSSVLDVEIDALGNAFTTEMLEYKNGKYFAIQRENGAVDFMNGISYSGQCNLCHGQITDRLD